MLLLAAAHAAPFDWTVRVDGKESPTRDGASVSAGVSGWRCVVAIDPSQQRDGATEQFGFLRCTSSTTVETTVMCRTTATQPSDIGIGTFLVADGTREVGLELRCQSPGAPARPRLQVEPGTTPGAAPGLPATRVAPTGTAFRWQLAGADGDHLITAPGAVPTNTPGWTCAQEISAVTDPTYGAAQYGTLRCTEGKRSATLLVPCVREEAQHVCQAGALRVGESSWMLLCEDTGNPGCF